MIKASGLRKTFKKRVVLDNVNLEISKGERVVLIGRNGSGKTTFIRCLLGLYNHEGDLTVNGMNPRKDREKVLRNIGYVPQTPPLINMRAIDLVRYVADISESSVESIIDIAEKLMFNVEVDLNNNFMRLSGGMKQKLLIAIAIGRNSDIIIMDEPTANLDPNSRMRFFEVLLHNVKEDATVILTSHRADELSFFAHRIIEMDYGRIIKDEKI